MIFAVVGKSGSGKTSIVEKIKDKIPVVIQYTTRPKRFGELNGINYNFKTQSDFLRMIANQEMASYQSFKVANGDTWFYGYKKSSIECHENCILVTNPKELIQLKNVYRDKIVVIEIKASQETRIARYFNRDNMTQDNIKEMTRRMVADEKDFLNVIPDIVIENEEFLDGAVAQLRQEIEKAMQVKEPMKRLHFYTGTMRSGKSAMLIDKYLNAKQSGIPILAIKPAKDTRDRGKIVSRNGKSIMCKRVSKDVDLYMLVRDYIIEKDLRQLNVYIDEVQFLTTEQVRQIYEIITKIKFVKIYCAGLLTSYKGNFFEASQGLLLISDRVVKVPYLCECCNTNNATNHILKVDGKAIFNGEEFITGDKEFLSTCLNCWIEEYKKSR